MVNQIISGRRSDRLLAWTWITVRLQNRIQMEKWFIAMQCNALLIKILWYAGPPLKPSFYSAFYLAGGVCQNSVCLYWRVFAIWKVVIGIGIRFIWYFLFWVDSIPYLTLVRRNQMINHCWNHILKSQNVCVGTELISGWGRNSALLVAGGVSQWHILWCQ